MVFALLLGGMTPATGRVSKTEAWMVGRDRPAEVNVEFMTRVLHQAAQSITITDGPSQDELVNEDDFPVVFEVPGNAGTECLFSKGPETLLDWFACTSPLSLAEYLQGEGQYTLRIRIIGDPAVSSSSEAVLTFHVDLTEPDTAITSYTNSSEPTTFSFEFEGLNDDVDHFECDLDYSGNWERCRSPRTYTSLVYGEHVFAVRAVDIAGNSDSTPATRLFRVEHPSRPSPSFPSTEALPSEISEEPNASPNPTDVDASVSPVHPDSSAESNVTYPEESSNVSTSPDSGSRHGDASMDAAASNAASPDDVSNRNSGGAGNAKNETESPNKVEEISSNSWYTIVIIIGVAVASVIVVILVVICCSKGKLSCCHIGISCCIR